MLKIFVIVVRPSERKETLQQGYAITQSKSVTGQCITTWVDMSCHQSC